MMAQASHFDVKMPLAGEESCCSSYTDGQAGLKDEIPKKEPAIQNLRDQVSGADSFIS